MEDDNSMSERILRTLETIFNTDTELKEFSIVPAESNTKNKSPVLYEEHNVGLESWCVKHIYRYAYLELFEVRKQLSKKKLSLCKERNLNHLLTGVLLINPDVTTFWNMKRELVENEVLSVADELLFTKMVLSYKSKSNEAFSYRRWLIKRILSKIQANDIQTPQNLLENELSVCEMAAAKNSNNYHAWTHRIWSIETIGNRLVTTFSNVIFNELDFSHRWLSEHVSEHTSYHYRQYLFDTVKKSKNIANVYEFYYNQAIKHFRLVNENDPRDILTFLLGKEKPLEESNNYVNFFCLLLFDLHNTIEMLNSVYPNHESIWYHRKYLIYHLIKTSYEYHDLIFKIDCKIGDVSVVYGTNIVNLNSVTTAFNDGEKKPKLFKSQPNKVQASLLYQTLVKGECEFIKKNSSRSSIYYELELAKRYERWLKFVICIEDL